jgi:hypothetical protein
MEGKMLSPPIRISLSGILPGGELSERDAGLVREEGPSVPCPVWEIGRKTFLKLGERSPMASE